MSSSKYIAVLALGLCVGVQELPAQFTTVVVPPPKEQKPTAPRYVFRGDTVRDTSTVQRLAEMSGVHAMTDVTGFGLAGHLLGMARGSGLAAEVRFADVPFVAEALAWAQRGVATGASDRNWNGYGKDVSLPAGAPDWVRKLLTDPQTSGGLLVACAPDAERAVLEAFAVGGFAEARTIGRLAAGAPRLTVT